MDDRQEYPTESDLIHWFTYHAPGEDQPRRYEALRTAAYELSVAIQHLCPPSSDRTRAILKVREAIMFANASIALGGR